MIRTNLLTPLLTTDLDNPGPSWNVSAPARPSSSQASQDRTILDGLDLATDQMPVALGAPYSSPRVPRAARVNARQLVGPRGAEAQVTRSKSLPEPSHRHPDKEEVRGSSPRTPTSQQPSSHGLQAIRRALIIIRPTCRVPLHARSAPRTRPPPQLRAGQLEPIGTAPSC
jgi:hypothetical protein